MAQCAFVASWLKQKLAVAVEAQKRPQWGTRACVSAATGERVGSRARAREASLSVLAMPLPTQKSQVPVENPPVTEEGGGVGLVGLLKPVKRREARRNAQDAGRKAPRP
jgi:hypothetical protein